MMINDHRSYTHITRMLKEFGCQDVSQQEFQSFFNNFRRVWSGSRAAAFSRGGGRGSSFWQRFSKLFIQTFMVNSQTESLSFGKDCIRCHKKSSSSCSEYGTLLFTLSLVLVSEVAPTHSGEGFTSFAKDVALDNSSWQEAGPRRWSRLFFTILLDFHLRKGRPGRVVQISCKIIALP